MTHKHYVRTSGSRGNTGTVHMKHHYIIKNSQGKGLLLFPQLGGLPQPLNTNLPDPAYMKTPNQGEGLHKNHSKILEKIKKIKKSISLKI